MSMNNEFYKKIGKASRTAKNPQGDKAVKEVARRREEDVKSFTAKGK